MKFCHKPTVVKFTVILKLVLKTKGITLDSTRRETSRTFEPTQLLPPTQTVLAIFILNVNIRKITNKHN